MKKLYSVNDIGGVKFSGVNDSTESDSVGGPYTAELDSAVSMTLYRLQSQHVKNS